MKRFTSRSKKLDILKAYEQLEKDTERQQKVQDGLSEGFSSLKAEHKRLQEKTEFIEGLRQRLGALNQRMDLLTKISQELNSLDMDVILDLCISKIPFLLNAKYTSIYLYDPEKERLILRKSNHNRPLRTEIPRSEIRTLMGLAIDRREILVIEDLEEFNRGVEMEVSRPYSDRYATNSCIIAPLAVGEQLVGIINFADRNDGVPFDEQTDLQPIRALVGILASAIRNVQLYDQVQRQSSLDGLTGLLNHSAFNERLEREVQRARRYRLALSLILTDVDHFRAHNANLGHAGGDAILAMVSRVIAQTLRTVDIAGRYGADEFALILPETSFEGAILVASRVVERVKGDPFSYQGRKYEITASAGVVSLPKEGSHTEMLSKAEEAIRAKRVEGQEGVVVPIN